MVDPCSNELINYNRSQAELEEFLIFCILVAGKNAETTAKGLERFLQPSYKMAVTPFIYIRSLDEKTLSKELKNSGIGCYNQKSKFLKDLVNSNIDLNKCSIQELEQIKGIGPKTSRFFVLFSRENAECAVLDVHILRWLNKQGYDVLAVTPGEKEYLEIKKIFIKEAKKRNKRIVDFDFQIWTEQRK